MSDKVYYIREIAAKTGVKATTIRFYERAGFLEPVKRLNNRYRIFNAHHVFQVLVCSLVFGGFINSRLRKISMGVIAAAKKWNKEAYSQAAKQYLTAIQKEIIRANRAIGIVTKKEETVEKSTMEYAKKEAADLLGVSPETIRGWERNGLLRKQERYSRRLYTSAEIHRMEAICLLLDIGYSSMAILRFFTAYDEGKIQRAARLLQGNVDDEDLISRADRYLKALETAKGQAEKLCRFADEMKTF